MSCSRRPGRAGSGADHAHATFSTTWVRRLYTSKRYRASYYVTEVLNGVESLPKRIYGIGVTTSRAFDAGERSAHRR